jgi:hypothetical protein
MSYAEHLYLNGVMVTEVVVPKEATFIPEHAFASPDIISVTLHDGIQSIGNCAFNLSSITSIVIPDSVTEIGYMAFSGCTELVSVTMSQNVTNIESYAFFNCKKLESIELPEGLTRINSSTFEYCSTLTKINIPSTVVAIDYSAFGGCSSLSTIEWADSSSVSTIGRYAFSGVAIEYLEIPTSVRYIEDEAFRYCQYLKNVVINEGLTSIGNSAFIWCSALESISLPTTLTTIRAFAFAGCTSLNKLYISDLEKWCQVNLEQYDSSPLHKGGTMYVNGEAIVDLVIPESITTVNAYSFYGADVQQIIIHSAVTEIGTYAFGDCDSLKTIIIPSSVTTMVMCIFNACNGLEQILCEATHKPQGWDDLWSENAPYNVVIIWGYSENN